MTINLCQAAKQHLLTLRASRLKLFVGLIALLAISTIIFVIYWSPTEQPTEIFISKEKAAYGRIPKIIHQTFTSAKIFSEYRKYIEHCLKLNPDWQYYLWTDEDIVAFINDHYPYFMRKYLIYKMHVQRGDSIRYMVLHHFGGIYIDMDVECVKPFFPSLSNLTAFVDQEAKEHSVILYGKDFGAMNSAMGSVPRHHFFMRLVLAMMQVDDKVEGAGPTTGPELLTAQLINWWAHDSTKRHEVTLLEPTVFSPLIDDKLHNFQKKCKEIQSSQRPTAAAELKFHEHRLRLCLQYAQRNWKSDLSGPETVGRHLFLHLGYRWRMRRPSYFDIREIAKHVKFYTKNKDSIMSAKLDSTVLERFFSKNVTSN